MRPYLDPHDHAFANGPVFPRPASLEAAQALFDRPEDGDRLMALFEAFERGAEVGAGLRLSLNARLVTPGNERRVRIGRNCAIRGVLRCDGEGRIALGDEVHVGDGVIVSARRSIEIGDGVLIAHGVQLFDNDTHPADPQARRDHFRAFLKLGPKGKKPDDFEVAAAPIRIGPGAWLGFSSAVMKGVAIGEEAIVAAGAVVTADVPARSVAAGNPARLVKSLDGRPAPIGLLARLLGRG
jgi:acetyltransferase-like isoleucine patch superfamily enzyme